MEDKQIIKLLFARAEEALRILRERFGNTLYRIAINILGNYHDAEETTADVLNDGTYGKMIFSGDAEEGWQNKKYMKVNLSVPKFDVSSSVNLKDGLGKMGVTKVFDIKSSDFTAITSDTPVYVSAVNQSARVEIDEKGVKAATYIEIPGAGSAMPPEEIIDFALNRPFAFVISKGNLPLFTGVVNNI